MIIKQRRPSKAVTPAADVEREKDGNSVLCHGDDEVEACNLRFDVGVLRGLRVVLKI